MPRRSYSSFSSRSSNNSLSFRRQSRRGFLGVSLAALGVVAAGVAGWWSGVIPSTLGRVAGDVATAVPGGGAATPGGGGTQVAGTATKPGATPDATATPTPATPLEVARRYLAAWQAGDYAAMHTTLSPEAQGRIGREPFVDRYKAIHEEAGIKSVAAVVAADATDAMSAVPYQVTIETRVGQVVEQQRLPLVQSEGRWGVDWQPPLIFKDLSGDRLVRFVPDNPARGRILDRNGKVLAEQGEAPVVGVIPAQIKSETVLLEGLSGLLGMSQDEIRSKYATSPPDWYIPLKRLPWTTPEEELVKIQKIAEGVQVRMVPERVYPQGELAAHVIGYVTLVQAEDLAKGYVAGDRVGRTGIEAFAEKDLAGERGGAVTIIERDGTPVTTLTRKQARPGADVTLTLDLDIQKTAHEALGDRRGAVVVLDPKDSAVVAMVSKPSFDLNGFVLGFSDDAWQRLNDEKLRPLMNRVTDGVYPPGSIFKVVTMSAGMEKLGWGPGHTFSCPGSWKLPNAPQIWLDWKLSGHGKIDLVEGLTTSCDIVFYTIGKEVEDQDGQDAFPQWTRLFGLGKPTGLPELPEAAGNVPDDAWKKETFQDVWATGDTINFSIGQGFLLTTPLQMAVIYVAFANGSTGWRPYLIKQISVPNSQAARITEPKELFKLPVKEETLSAVRAGLNAVPTRLGGTGYEAFKNYAGPPAAGKTGTAETGVKGVTHAWFASYAPQQDAQLVTVSLVEEGTDAEGEGSRAAAPIARMIFERHLGGGQPRAESKPAAQPSPAPPQRP